MTPTTTISFAVGGIFNNLSFGEPDQDEVISQIISHRIMFYFNLYLHFIICGVVGSCGIANNIINMIIFHRIGLKDSMSIGLMALSFTDFLVSLISVIRIGFFIWDTLVPDSTIDPLGVNHVSIGWWRDLLFLCSSWITTFLSIERCVCVVFPFKVKSIFKKSTAIMAVVVIYVVNIGAHVPVFLSQWLGWTQVEVKTANGTALEYRLVAMFSENRPQIQFYIDIANGAILPIPSQFLVLVSVLWMIYGLNISSRIRNPYANDKGADDGQTNKSNLSYKERRLVKVVLFLAVILTLCNIPRFIAVYAKQLFPQVSFRNSYGNLYMLLWNVAIFGSIVNSSVNILVYLIVNSNYRSQFKELFFCKM